jgi:hypothetical protein
MQDEVYNRALFRRRAESAREKLREMGGVGPQGPRGIMASSPELMAAAMPRAMTPQTTGPMPNMMAPQMRPAAAPMQAAALPNIVPGMFPQQPQQQPQAPQAPYQTRQPAPQPQPQPMQPGQPKQQPQPIRLNQGGDIALAARRQGLPEPSLGAQIAANPAFAGIRAVDITEAPTPRGRSTEGDVLAEVRAILGDNPTAQARVDDLETTLTDPDATPDQQKQAITTAAGVENDKEGLRSVVTDLTGEEPPANATVDELNRAIMGVSIGGAIGGPGSVAERISNAILQGLQVQRETAMGRELLESKIALAELERSRLYSDSAKDLETKHFGKIPQFMPTLPGTLAGATPIIAGEQDRIIMTYNTAMDESDRLLELSAEAESLLDKGDVAGFEGSASRFLTRATAALPDPVADALGVDKENPRASAAQRFDVIQRTLAAQLAPMLLGESGRTISDGDRRRVAELLGIVTDDKDGLGLNINGLASGAFRSETELREAIREVNIILQQNRQEVESEFEMLAARIPGLQVQRSETSAPTAAPAAAPSPSSPAIVLTEEDITRLGG